MHRTGGNSRVLAIVATAVVGTAVALAAIPALAGGRGTVAVPAPPVVRSGSKAVVFFSSTSQQIATMSIPKGTWVIWEKMWIENFSGTLDEIHCTLNAGGTKDVTQIHPEALGTGADELPVALMVTHKYAAAGSATVTCTAGSTSTDAFNIRMVAMKVGTFTSVSLG